LTRLSARCISANLNSLLTNKLRFERMSIEAATVDSALAPSTILPSKETPPAAEPLFSTKEPIDRKRLTVERAAEYLGIAKQTLYQWCSEKKIPHKKIGSKTLSDPDELDAWIAKHHVKPIGEVDKARLTKKLRKEP